jgi:hypothetical protein
MISLVFLIYVDSFVIMKLSCNHFSSLDIIYENKGESRSAICMSPAIATSHSKLSETNNNKKIQKIEYLITIHNNKSSYEGIIRACHFSYHPSVQPDFLAAAGITIIVVIITMTRVVIN